MKHLLPIIILALASLACLETALIEEAGTAAPSTALSPTEGTPFDHPENPAGEVFYPPASWQEPQGYHLCATVTAIEALNLRSAPDEKSDVITWLLSGEQVKVIKPGGNWWKIETSNGQRGYARAKYLQEEECP